MFLTDDEFAAAFGAQVAEANRMLEKYTEVMCRNCSRCCRMAQCECYSERFEACPIFEYRPAKCRLYYCSEILENKLLTEQELLLIERAANDVSDALARDRDLLETDIGPPLKPRTGGYLGGDVGDQAGTIIHSLGRGEISLGSARDSLTRLVRESRRLERISGTRSHLDGRGKAV